MGRNRERDMSLAEKSDPLNDLNGFDPLAEGAGLNSNDRSVFEEATRRVVQNVLKSYTGYFDIFSELIQNALDAIDKKLKSSPKKDYLPRIWIKIDVATRTIRIVDNGCGMSFGEVRFCFRPNVSFKNRKEARGHKGVGATFLAYGFGLIRLATKQGPRQEIAVRLSNGRQWADDQAGSYPRPRLELDDFDVPELKHEHAGTAVEISVSAGQRPDLGWWNATTAQQWYQILRMRTPLGGVYLSGEIPPKVKVDVTVIDYANNSSHEEFEFVEYPYPHELPQVLSKVKSYEEVREALSDAEGDSAKIPQELKGVDALYGIWTADQIVAEESPFAGQKFSEDQEELIRRHNVAIYGCFMSSAKQWGLYQRDVLRIRKDPLILKGGLLIASDYMVQGDLSVIPLTSTIGYQANTHVIVHFRDGNPDMGRKVFQPELKSLAEDLARQVVNIFKRYLYLMREDTGAANLANETDTYHWIEEKKKYRTDHPLEFTFDGKQLAYACKPCAEQDVIAVFHELVGLGLIKGIRFLCTTERDRYDGCYVGHYDSADTYGFDAKKRPFGVSQKIISARESKPQVLEYKFDLDGLIADFAKEVKFQNQINGIVCWTIGNNYQENFSVRSYLVGEEGSARQLYGATHALYHERMRLADIICLSDLIRFLSEPEAVVAEHKTRFKN
jgi:hypothetical protein